MKLLLLWLKKIMKNKTVIYTAIFGGKDNLIEPEFIPKGCDFICFTDNENLKSDIWQVRKVEPTFSDPVRNARMYKVLSHKFLAEYEYSIWIDGNLLLKGDVNKLIKKYLSNVNLAIFNHNQHKKRWKKLFWIKNTEDCRDCVYQEVNYLLKIGEQGKYKDDPALIKKQMEKYRREKYPERNGLAVSMIILRKHNEADIIQTMEAWWQEIKNHSRRDQLSFNFVVWKNNLKFVYIKGDSRRNKYFLHRKHKIRLNPKL